jgi:hypothetical protein
MRQIITEVEGEGLDSLLGKSVLVFCLNYIYTGTLIGVNDTFIKLGTDAAVVYATGPFTDKKYADVQSLNQPAWYIQRAAIESFGPGK